LGGRLIDEKLISSPDFPAVKNFNSGQKLGGGFHEKITFDPNPDCLSADSIYGMPECEAA
jgi:hypothetical protein